MFFPAHPPKPFTGTCVSKEMTDPRKSTSGMSPCAFSEESQHMSHRHSGHVMSGWTVMCGAEMQLSSTYRRTGGVRPQAQASSVCSPWKSGANAVTTLLLPFAFHPAPTCSCMKSTSPLADDNFQNIETVLIKENRQPDILLVLSFAVSSTTLSPD